MRLAVALRGNVPRFTTSSTFTRLPLSSFPHLSGPTAINSLSSVRFASSSPDVIEDVAPVDVTETVELVADATGAIAEVAEVSEPFFVIKMAHAALGGLHDVTGLPWWATIITMTVMIRAALIPVAVVTYRANATMAKVKPGLDAIGEEMRAHKESSGGQLTPEENMYYKQKYEQVCAANGFSFGKILLMPLSQAPIFMTLFFSLRQLSRTFEDANVGGAYWFTDLTVPDPNYILPVIASAVSLAALESGGETGGANPQMAKFKNIMRLMLVGVIPVTAQMPAGVFMYWITNSIWSALMGFSFRREAVKKFFKIPIVPKEVTEYTKQVQLSAKDKAAMSPLERTRMEMDKQLLARDVKASMKSDNNRKKVEYAPSRGSRRKFSSCSNSFANTY